MSLHDATTAHVTALVPAAGRSERFGAAKLLALWRGRELLAHLLDTLREAREAGSLGETIVVLRGDDAALRSVVARHRAHSVPASNAGELSDSLRAGLAHLSATAPRGREAALICLGDQPLLRLEVVQRVIEEWRAGTAAAIRARYADTPDQPGHPFLLDRSLWHHAEELRGERGFDAVLFRHGIAVHCVVVPGSNPDVDTRADLRALDTPTTLRT